MVRKSAEKEPVGSARDRLYAKGKKTESVTAAKKEDRPVVQIENPEVALAADQFSACNSIRKNMEAHEKAAKSLVEDFGKTETFKRWIENGTKTENIKLTTPAGTSLILQVKDTLSGKRGFRIPKDKDNNPMEVGAYLKNQGVPEAIISSLIDEEEFVEVKSMIIPMDKLEKDSPALADKLIEMILAANEQGLVSKDGKTKFGFTNDEIEKLIETVHDISVKKDFLSRIVNIVKKSIKGDTDDQIEALKSVLGAVSPQYACSSVIPGMNKDEILHGMLGIATEDKEGKEGDEKKSPIPPSSLEYTIDFATVKVIGLKIEIIRNTDKKTVATKMCTDAKHVGNTIKKWQTVPGSLQTYVAENA